MMLNLQALECCTMYVTPTAQFHKQNLRFIVVRLVLGWPNVEQ